MAKHLTPGKLAGLQAISDDRGVVAAVALDQRGILKKAITRAMCADDVPDSVIVEFKVLVAESLTKFASAILLDPEYGLPAAKRRNRKGLLLAYEFSNYDAPPPRMPILYDHWSVRRLKEAGADGIKVLLHYTPFDTPEINDQKQAWVERVGDECRANDIPFVLEMLGYATSGEDKKSLAYAKRKPEIVARSVREFSKERYSADLLKVEVPVEMAFVPGSRSFRGEPAYTRAEAGEHFCNIDQCTRKPYVYLSAGVSHLEFVEALNFAAECGSRFNGVLCGRATWQEGVPVFAQQGPKGLQDWLDSTGVEHIRRVNEALRAARPWHEKMPASAPVADHVSE